MFPLKKKGLIPEESNLKIKRLQTSLKIRNFLPLRQQIYFEVYIFI